MAFTAQSLIAEKVRRPALWLWREPDAALVATLRRELGLSTAVAQILVQRGFHQPDTASAFLHPSLDQMHACSLLRGIEPAVARISRAIAGREKNSALRRL